MKTTRPARPRTGTNGTAPRAATGRAAVTRNPSNTSASISDAAVLAKTGQDWAAWYALLDQAGGMAMDHKGLVAVLADGHGVGPWWQQMIAVEYERARGLRAVHETPRGFSISKSCTLDASPTRVFNAWHDAKARAQWLDEAITIRKATAPKNLRITWSDGKTNVDVNLYPKGEGRCQLSVQHDKLLDAQAGERMKAFWSAALPRLAALLDGVPGNTPSKAAPQRARKTAPPRAVKTRRR